MVTLDDKLLGEKLHYYCSSSEDEDEPEQPSGSAEANPDGARGDGSTANTGPKGVLQDWQRYKQLQSEMRDEKDAEFQALAKKLSMTCKSEREEREEKDRELKARDELDEMFDEDDEFFKDYIKQRMLEMVERNMSMKRNFGNLIQLQVEADFLNAIDKEEKDVIIVILISEERSPGCAAVEGCLVTIAKEYDHIKFCKIDATSAGLSKQFKDKGVPAILVYKAGDQIASHIRITDTLGDDFFADDLEGFLVDNGVLHDRKLLPSTVRGPASHADRNLDEDA